MSVGLPAGQKKLPSARPAVRPRTVPTPPANGADERLEPDRGERTGTDNFNSISNSDNLAPGAEPEDSDSGPPATPGSDADAAPPDDTDAPQTPRPGTENFNSIFETDNLGPGSD